MYILVTRGRMHAILFKLLTVLAVALSTAVSSRICPDPPKKPTGLHFVDKFPEQPMVEKQGDRLVLTCCTGDWPCVNVSWFKVDKTTGRQYPVVLNSFRYLHHHGQALVFRAGDAKLDSGSYLCIAFDNQSSINRTFTVEFVECDLHPKVIITTKPNQPIQASVNQNFNQTCEGDFGCFGALQNDSVASWSYVDEQGHTHNLSEGESQHYSIMECISYDKTSKVAVLTFTVAKEDFSRRFVCSLHKNGLPSAGFNVTLSERDEEPLLNSILGYACPMTFVLLLVVVTGGVRFFCRPLAVYKFRSCTKRLPKRKQDQIYDAMLVVGEDCDDLERVLDTELQQMGYKMYSVQEGHSEVDQVDLIEKCATVIFVLSSYRSEVDASDSQENIVGLSNYLTVCFESECNIVFVHSESLRESEWDMLCQDFKKVSKELLRKYPKAEWPASGSWLKRINFWSKVRTSLPPPYSNDDERRPLLDPINS